MRTKLPYLIWLAAAATSAWLWWHVKGPREPFPGVVGVPPAAVAALRTGRLVEVSAKLGSTVPKGEVLARFDTSAVEADLAVARAELVTALAEVEATAAQGAIALQQTRLQVIARRAEAETAVSEVKSRQAAARAELRSLATSLGKIRKVADRGLARGDRVATLESRQARLRREASPKGSSVKAWEEFSKRLDGAMATLEKEGGDALLGPARARVDMTKKRIEALLVERGELDLKAPRAGVIGRILARPGTVLRAATPVVEIFDAEPTTVHAWLPEQRTRLLAVGANVQVLSQDRNLAPVPGTVTQIGPVLEPLPNRLWLDTKTATFGRRVEVALGGPGLLPGEAVQVSPR